MSCSNPVSMKITDKFGVQHYPVDISGKPVKFPCGYCIGCKQDKINLWTNRITYEYSNRSSSFVALTYDSFHLHFNKGYYEPSLNRQDLHKFIDNLRHYLNKYHDCNGNSCNDFKYFAVGEYGGKAGRPHYHVLLLGVSPQIASHVIPKLWKHGSTRVDPMFRGSVSYVLKYMSKQQNKDYNKMHFTAFGLDVPFISVSPRVGADFFLAHRAEILEYGCIKDGVHNIQVPNYWKNKVFIMFGSQYYIDKQKEYKRLQNEKNLKFAKDHGYWSFDSYMLEQARLKERELIQDCRRNGIPVEEYRNYGHISYKVPKNYSLVERYRTNLNLAFEAINGCLPKDY